jgi:hypothetical protein
LKVTKSGSSSSEGSAASAAAATGKELKANPPNHQAKSTPLDRNAATGKELKDAGV